MPLSRVQPTQRNRLTRRHPQERVALVEASTFCPQLAHQVAHVSSALGTMHANGRTAARAATPSSRHPHAILGVGAGKSLGAASFGGRAGKASSLILLERPCSFHACQSFHACIIARNSSKRNWPCAAAGGTRSWRSGTRLGLGLATRRVGVGCWKARVGAKRRLEQLRRLERYAVTWHTVLSSYVLSRNNHVTGT